MISVIFALVSFLGWGIGDIFGTITTRRIGPFSTTFWSAIFGGIIYTFYIPFALNQLANFTLGILLLNIVLSLILIFSMVTFYESLKIESSPLVGVIAASGFSLVPILSISFLGEKVTFWQGVAIIITFVGLILSIYNFSQFKKRDFRISKGIFWALVTMVCWGIYYTFIKIPVEQIGWFWPNYFYITLTPLLLLFMRKQKIKLALPKASQIAWPLFINVLLMTTAELSYTYALDSGLAAIVGPIAGSYPALFVILAFLIFKDPITKQQIGGVITTLVGIVLLSWLSV